MPAILRDLPFFNHRTIVEVGGQQYPVYARQHVVWISLGPAWLIEPDLRAPRFPAIYDSGFTDGFLIHRTQLRHFAGLHPDSLRDLGTFMRPRGLRLPRHAAKVWLHPNRRGQRDQFSGAVPFLLEIPLGIGVCNEPEVYPRLPLLGSLAFLPSGMEVCINHAKLRINARTPRRFWFF